MELSMKRSGIACCEKVFEYAMPVEQATETVVPDTMPDVERILCAEGMVIIRSKEVSEGRVTVSAGVAATVLYSPEGGGRPCRLSAVVPIELELDARRLPADADERLRPQIAAACGTVCRLFVHTAKVVFLC